MSEGRTKILSLPFEIQQMILTYAGAINLESGEVGPNLHLDRVCQIWREIIQTVLFSSIELKASAENEPGLDKYNGANLDLAEVIFRTNPVLATYVRTIKIGFLYKLIDRKDITVIKAAMVKIWNLLALIAEPRVKRSKNLIFAPRRESLKIIFEGFPDRAQHNPPQPFGNNIKLSKGYKLPDINAPVEIELRDAVLRGRYFSPDSINKLVDTLTNCQRLKFTYNFMDGIYEHHRQYYPYVLKSLRTLPNNITHLELDFHSRIFNDRGQLRRDVFEAPIYCGGRGDRLNQILRQIMSRLKYFKYTGPVTPELFGELPLCLTALHPINGNVQTGPKPDIDKPTIRFPDLEELYIRFDIHDSFGEPYFERTTDYREMPYIGMEDDEYLDDIVGDHFELVNEVADQPSGYLGGSLSFLSSSVSRRSRRNDRYFDNPNLYTAKRDMMSGLSSAYTNAMKAKMPKLNVFSIKDYAGVSSFVLAKNAFINQKGLIPPSRLKEINDVKDKHILYIRHFRPTGACLADWKERYDADQKLVVKEDKVRFSAAVEG
ncbi:hypothetical protein V1508DRAFT_406206 [Lipomyces doorenjongii]|uniref:uncharacterized protein n=1 Tax=Lipomyces doorenjongii TaxID=383834 RepID=UPI0034CFA80F